MLHHRDRVTADRHSLVRTFGAVVWAIAALALPLGSAGLPSAARAQEIWTYRVQVANPPVVICTNQTVTYRVSVLAVGPPVPNAVSETEVVLMNPGLALTAAVSDSTVGDFTNAGAALRPLPGGALTAPDTVEFTFKATDKAGPTTLTFGASDISFEAEPFVVPVTVQHCQYEVLAVSRWAASYGAGSIKFLAVTYGAQMAVDADGGYAGTGRVVWISTSAVRGCTVKNTLNISDVTLRGSRDESGRMLQVKLTYAPTQFTDALACIPGGGGGNVTAQASPLDLSVPLFGGTVTIDHILTGGPAPITGHADVYVVPLHGVAGQ